MIIDVAAPQPYRVADLHCDLLYYLAHDRTRTAYDRAVRCAIPQLREGDVALQTMAISSDTVPSSSIAGWAQAELFRQLPLRYPDDFFLWRRPDEADDPQHVNKIGVIAAIENMSALCGEEDDLEKQLEKFAQFRKKVGKILYLSLTWNHENRFGGGTLTSVGLKEDGKRVLTFMAHHGIAFDLSHASDRLANEAIEFIDRAGLKLPILASHSNMRSVNNLPRNMPDSLAKEVMRRGGVIGLNLIRYLLGKESPRAFVQHLQHLIALGGEQQVCLGADFFYPADFPIPKPIEELFFSQWDNASCYPALFALLERELSLPRVVIEDLAYHNLMRFMRHTIAR